MPQEKDLPLGSSKKPSRFTDTRTLILIAAAIFACLAVGFFAITIPLFRSANTEPKQKEAEDILASVYVTEMDYYSRNRCFSSEPSAIGLTPPKTRRYEWAIISADCTAFVARAWTNLDNDPNLDIWEITNYDAFRPLHVFDDEKDIGYRIDPKSTDRWRPENGHFRPPVNEKQ